jgi:hypothetical protein
MPAPTPAQCIRAAVFTLCLIVATPEATSAAESAQPPLLIESLEGPVTAREITAFQAHMAALPLPGDNSGNAMVYGAAGSATEALGAMFEITSERAILDRMLAFTDAMLAARNDPHSGRVLWTGQRELVWPNKRPADAEARYSATENGDVVAHIAYAALLILARPELQAARIPGGDPHGFGLTYGARARTYVRELDRTTDTFLLKWLVHPDTHRYHFPTAEGWAAIGPRYSKGQGQGVPWNQQMMLNGGFQRLAQCHERLGDDPARVARYDRVVRASCDWFFSQLRNYAVQGHDCYKWSYAAEDPTLKYIEDTGHAGYDVLVWRAYSSGRYGITREMMVPFASTVLHVLRQPDGRFATRVDGSPRADRPPTAHLGSNWLLLAELHPDLYSVLATAARAAARSRPDLAARILWAKHRRLGAGAAATVVR